MASRDTNLNTIGTFLRDRYDESRRVISTTNSLPPEQRDAVIRTQAFEQNTKTDYTIAELDHALQPNLGYHQIRYALIGYEPGVIKNHEQPKALTKRGIVIDYEDGHRKPRFRYDPEMQFRYLAKRPTPVLVETPTEQELMEKRKDPEYYKAELDAAVEPDKNEAAPPVETECDNVHVRKWLVQALHQIYNANSMGADDNGMLTVDGSPLVGLFLVSADWANEHGMHTDWPGIPHNMEYAKREDVPE